MGDPYSESSNGYEYRVKGHWNGVWQSTGWVESLEVAKEQYLHIKSGNWMQISIQRRNDGQIERKANPDKTGWFEV